MKNMKSHPAADVFPLLEGAKFKTLVEDIKAKGLMHPIILLGKLILDGRNRYRACRAAHVQPAFRQYSGKDPVGYVVSANLARRHLDESQRSMCASYVQDMFEAEAKERQRIGGREKGTANLREAAGTSAEKAAALFNVSGRSVESANKVRREGAADLVAAVRQGEIKVSAAAEIAALPKNEQRAVVGRVKRGEISGAHAKTEVQRTVLKAKLEDVASKKAKAVEGVFDVLVIDPPWPMEKIERDVRPNQVSFDYPTMTEAELADVKKWYGKNGLPCAKDAHVWLWATHKFLPMALRLLGAWELNYVCTFVWRKPGGFQPIGLPQYNCEFALYARRGSPKFVDTKKFNTCFDGQRGGHSEKPEEFYDVVRRVTAGRRLDIFNRRTIRGFEGWGKEIPQLRLVKGA